MSNERSVSTYVHTKKKKIKIGITGEEGRKRFCGISVRGGGTVFERE